MSHKVHNAAAVFFRIFGTERFVSTAHRGYFFEKTRAGRGAGLCSGGFASGEKLRRWRTTACNNLMVRPTNKFPFMDRASVGRQSLRYL
jgi:hypothetical protein